MRRALPIWYCLPEITKEKLARMDDALTIPPPQWVDWLPEESQRVQTILDDVDYDKFMRQARSR